MPPLSEDDRAAFRHLQWATQALGLDAEEQLRLYPDFVDKPSELLDEYENWYQATKWRDALPISNVQASALASIFNACLGMPDGLINEASLKGSKTWSDLRELARQGLEMFGWPKIPPPENRTTFVKGGN